MFLLNRDAEIAFSFLSQDFMDRPVDEQDLLGQLEDLGLSSVSPPPPRRGPAEPGPRRMLLDEIPIYFRGVNSVTSQLLERRPEGTRMIAELENARAQAQRFLRAARQTLRLRDEKT